MIQRVGVFCAASNMLDASYYTTGEQLGEWLSRHQKSLVYGGANAGMMEAVARGMKRNGGKVLGVVPEILTTKCRVSALLDEKISCKDLNDRKALLVEHSDILLALPGGVGTLDEIFTVMAAHTIGYHKKQVILFNLDGFWDTLLQLLHELDERRFMKMPLEECLLEVRSWEELEQILLR